MEVQTGNRLQIERSGAPKDQSDELLGSILTSPDLPSLPAIALEVIALVQRADVSVDELADVIAHDPALASKMLRIVNSSFYAQVRTMKTVREAVVILGINNVRSLALGFSLVDHLNRRPGSGFDHAAFWQRSVRTAIAARFVAERFTLRRGDEAFLGGLLGRLGVLAMADVLGDRYHSVFGIAGGDLDRLVDLEHGAFGFSHSEVGAGLAERWNLPGELVATLRDLETPESAPADSQDFVRAVAVGDALAGLFGEAAGRSLWLYRTRCADWLNLYPEQADEMVVEVTVAADAMLASLDLSAGEVVPAAVILRHAREVLANLEEQRQAGQPTGRSAVALDITAPRA